MSVMGKVYFNLELYSRAESFDQGALEIRRRRLGPEHPQTLLSMMDLGAILETEGARVPVCLS